MYELLGFCLALAALLTLNAFASLLAVGLWRSIERFTHHWSQAARANVIFALRVFPPAIAILCVLTLLVPAYIAYEPRTTAEVVSFKLVAIAFLSIVGLALALWRGFRTWRVTRRLVIDWLDHAEPINVENVSIQAYRITHRFPVVAVVGAFRPRLFIANQIFDTLNAVEIQAVVAHEASHLTAHDNLKRALVRACRDVLMMVPCGRSLDRAWAEAAEAAADERAARMRGATGALDLAEAMIKISRVVPIGAKPTMPAGAFLLAEAGGDVVHRVRLLTEMATVDPTYKLRQESSSSFIMWTMTGCLFVAIAFISTNAQMLLWMHNTIERVVFLLR
jgi:beta-lactamase regulating signal transducer with metallopeptidase domain